MPVIDGLEFLSVRIDAERQLLLIKGAVPGSEGGDVIVHPSVKANSVHELIDLARALDVPFDSLVSLQVNEDLNPVKAVFSSSLLREFPFDLFGIQPEDLFDLVTQDTVLFDDSIATNMFMLGFA